MKESAGNVLGIVIWEYLIYISIVNNKKRKDDILVGTWQRTLKGL